MTRSIQSTYLLALLVWAVSTPSGAQTSSPITSPISPPVAVGQPSSQAESAVKTVDQATQVFKQQGSWSLDNSMEFGRTPYVLRAGSVIPAILVTSIDSQLPGLIRAQVSQNVYDTPTGNYVLIPQGSQLLGEYSTGVTYGQTRVMVAWKRITFPDGRVLDIGAMPGTDIGGKSGFEDQVNNHYLRTFGSAILLSTIAGGIAYGVDKNTPVSASGAQQVTAQGEVATQMGNTLGQMVNGVLQKNLNLAPVVTIRSGYPFNVLATKDITMQVPYANVYREP